MRLADRAWFTYDSLRAHTVRTALVLLAVAIGVAAVLVLTALAEGARRYVADQLLGLGSNLLVVMPGKVETRGMAVPITSDVPQPISRADARALERSSAVQAVVPVVFGLAPARAKGREREVAVLGTTAAMQDVRRLQIDRGSFFAADTELASVCVLGSRVARELLGDREVVGAALRLGDRRLRVVGVLASKGTSLGLDMDDVVLVPVATAFQLFDTDALFRVLVQARSRAEIAAVERFVLDTLRARHDGQDDVTVVTQDALLGALDRVLRLVTFVLAAIAAVALVVAGVLVLNVMLILVTQRRAEVGLLKALGATGRQVGALFLGEAAALVGAGCAIGLLLGYLGAWILGLAWPALAGGPPVWAAVAATVVALAVGLSFGVGPARRAARLDPVAALARR